MSKYRTKIFKQSNDFMVITLCLKPYDKQLFRIRYKIENNHSIEIVEAEIKDTGSDTWHYIIWAADYNEYDFYLIITFLELLKKYNLTYEDCFFNRYAVSMRKIIEGVLWANMKCSYSRIILIGIFICQH